MAKMNDRVPWERLGTSRLNDGFSQNFRMVPAQEITSDSTLMQSKIKILQLFFNFVSKHDSSLQFTPFGCIINLLGTT